MPRLPRVSGSEAVRALERLGFAVVRQRGSHIIMRRELSGGDSATVPVPNHREVAIGTLKSIIRLSGLDAQLFRK